MRRIAATLILSLGTLLGVTGIGAGLASAQTSTPVAASATTADCYPGCSQPGHGHTTPTTHPTTTTTATARVAPAGNTAPTTVVFQASTTPKATSLAFTGTDAVATVVFGLAIIAGGGLLVQLSRRRRKA
jgi:uncharacterized surface anchored protein